MVATPYTPEMLMEAAELAGHAIVLSRRDGRARVRFTRLLKGRPRRRGRFPWSLLSRAVTVAYRSQPEHPRLGDWWNEDCFLPGNHILAHLHWSDAQDCYDAVWWNAIEVRERRGVERG